ncbi:MAG: GNAT family N-acetyltransferase [Acidimicrobiia bacterium]|nr:GNAT family N-acetyltransferase [Acidimicrobiia bacterium]
MELQTERLILRRWRPSDRKPFAAMNSDPEVMRHFVAPLTGQESDAFIDRIEDAFDIWGFGLWAIEVPGVAGFVGFTGLWPVGFEAHFTPAVEIGWRLSRQHWGFGYATEAASAALKYGLGPAGLDEVVSFTIPANVRSIAVMERIGMSHDPADDFDHPNIPGGSSLSRHVLYRMSAGRWRSENE